MSRLSAAKQALESLLSRMVGPPRRSPGRALVLAYHNVVPDHLAGQGDSSLHLPFSTFVRQLDLLQECTLVQPLADLLKGPSDLSLPHIAVTFDDAYAGAVHLALPELERRGLPSTLFVAPGLLGARSFWWDEYAIPGVGLPKQVRERALHECHGQAERLRDSLPAPASPLELPPCYGCVDMATLTAVESSGLVTMGAHSWSHPNLTRLGRQELEAELVRSLDWLRANWLNRIEALAYPYGATSPLVEHSTRTAGFEAALLVHGGWLALGQLNRWAIPRYNVPAGLSLDGFRLRLRGFLAT